MKALAKKILAACGLRLIRTAYLDVVPKGDPRHFSAVYYLYMLMRELALPVLPVPTETTIRGLATLGDKVSVPHAVCLLALLAETRDLPGAACEMGVAEGETSRVLADALADSGKELWLFDSFQGLPAPTPEDELLVDTHCLGSMAAYKGAMSHPRACVERSLAGSAFPRDRVHIVEGFFDETTPLKKRLPTQCSFAFVDFDFYKPITDALHYLHGVLVPGGCVAVHDYGHFSSGAQKAVDRFLEEHPGAYEFRPPFASALGLVTLKRKSV